MSRITRIRAALALLALTGCSLLAPDDAPLSNLELLLSDSVVVAPSAILFGTPNTSGEPLMWNACSVGAHRLDDGAWSQRVFPTTDCSAILYTLAVGQQLSLGLEIPAGTAPGTYRIQFRFRTEDDREVLAISSPFRIQ